MTSIIQTATGITNWLRSAKIPMKDANVQMNVRIHFEVDNDIESPSKIT